MVRHEIQSRTRELSQPCLRTRSTLSMLHQQQVIGCYIHVWRIRTREFRTSPQVPRVFCAYTWRAPGQ